MICYQSFNGQRSKASFATSIGVRHGICFALLNVNRSRPLIKSSTLMKNDDEAESLQSLMQEVRDKRAERMCDLQMEAHRLIDWKEYVRSAPIASLVGSVAAGFLVVSAFKQSSSQSLTSSGNQLQSEPRLVSGSNFQWALSMMMPIAMSAAKKFLMQSLTTATQGSHNENKSTSPSLPERRAYSE